MGDPPPKGEIVGHIVRSVDDGVMRWCVEMDLRQLCVNSHKQLMEMKVGFAFRRATYSCTNQYCHWSCWGGLDKSCLSPGLKIWVLTGHIVIGWRCVCVCADVCMCVYAMCVCVCAMCVCMCTCVCTCVHKFTTVVRL